MRALRFISALTASVLVLAGCSGQGQPSSPTPAEPSTAEETASSSSGVSEEDRQKARDIVQKMSADQLVGATIMGTYDGADPAVAGQMVKKNSLAGVIVMGYNLPDGAGPEDVKDYTGALREAAGERAWPVQLSVDQEGGPVARLKSAAYSFPPLMAFGAAGDSELTEDAMEAQGAQLADLGFTINWAPVADVTVGQKDPAVNVRAAGGSQETVVGAVEPAVKGYLAAGIGSSAKHFPGHGQLTVDSHVDLPESKKTLEEYSDTEWEPFEAAIEAGVPSVLVGHMRVAGAGDKPASLNPEVYEALRDELGFDGVAVTDGLNMGAITKGFPAGQETVEALKAGADLALMPPDLDAAVQAVKKAVDSGDLSEKDMRAKAERVVAMSLWQERAADEAGSGEGAGGGAGDGGDGGGDGGDGGGGDGGQKPADDVFNEVGRDSLTVLAGSCSAEPVQSVSISGPPAAAEALEKALKEHGIEAGGGTSVKLVDGTESSSGGADVVVGMSGPWKVASAAGNADTVLVTYADTEYAMNAVADYLAGELEASAQLPITLSGVKPPKCG
ncbi:glycoside hydrolase family 3 N-terminal domain-containing protein [Brevibacterium ravenspurgense]|uniref:glycoside hydrolase family 3 N-terminal domain-containing protein n=1 Tax=Brevibacterium ravenspurgense TaxID=479117 RepID=UPI0003045A4C|nr:glycoside hydrolase family 3 N-terminal domain-containing protein [Brevibacterium ravenspurgense]